MLKKNEKVLSVGVGCGEISRLWINKAIELKLSLYFIDFPKIIKKMLLKNQNATTIKMQNAKQP